MKKFFYLLIFLTLTVSDVIAEESDLPKGPLGKPDLNGVWQVLNSANFNLEAHAASASLAMVEGPIVPVPHPSTVLFGAVGSVPAGLGVVEGGTIPYKKKALKQRDENKQRFISHLLTYRFGHGKN